MCNFKLNLIKILFTLCVALTQAQAIDNYWQSVAADRDCQNDWLTHMTDANAAAEQFKCEHPTYVRTMPRS